MSDVIGKAVVVVSGQVDSNSIAQSGSTIGSSLKKGALIGVAALGSLAAVGVKSVLAFEDASAVSEKLGNVLSNMKVGDAAGEVEKLADSLQRVTGVDDDLIKSGETILGTFSAISSSAGELGGVFERATRLTVDLAAAGFGTVESAAVQLGKALQDPIKGVSALAESGVTFTQVQQDQIKNFIKTGDVAKAQNIILKEVEKQVGGTAEAGAKSSDKIARGVDEVKESIGRLITNLVTGKNKNKSFSDSLFTVADSLNKLSESDAWQDLGKVLRTVGRLIEHIADGTERLAQAFRDIPDLFNGGVSPATPEDLKGLKGLLLNGHLASGGRVNSSGFYEVGEQGPEIVKLPAGAEVFSNADSQNIGNPQTFVFNGPESFAAARREGDWANKYGTRFGSATAAAGL